MMIDAEDERGIRALYARAIHAFDAGSEQWLDFWDDDPVFVFGGDPAAGMPEMRLTDRAALAAMIGQFKAMTVGRGLHHFTNFAFDAVPEGVRVRAYLMLVVNGETLIEPSVIRQNSRIEDVVVKRGDRWLFRHRRVGATW
jgi:hypothetical protein